jgi:hypothetical protein
LGLLLGLFLDILLGLGLRLGQVEIVLEVVILLWGLWGSSLDRAEVLVLLVLVACPLPWGVQVLIPVVVGVVRGLCSRAGRAISIAGTRSILCLLLLSVVWPKDRR